MSRPQGLCWAMLTPIRFNKLERVSRRFGRPSRCSESLHIYCKQHSAFGIQTASISYNYVHMGQVYPNDYTREESAAPFKIVETVEGCRVSGNGFDPPTSVDASYRRVLGRARVPHLRDDYSGCPGRSACGHSSDVRYVWEYLPNHR